MGFGMGEVAGLRSAKTVTLGAGDVIFKTLYGTNARVLFPADSGNIAAWFRDDDTSAAAAVIAVVPGSPLVGDIVGIDDSGTTVTGLVAGF